MLYCRLLLSEFHSVAVDNVVNATFYVSNEYQSLYALIKLVFTFSILEFI